MDSFAKRRRRDLIVALCLAVIAALVPLFVKDVYVQNIMVLTLMYAALSQSWNILSGYCGQISLGHALYFGIGAYTTALLFTKFGVLPWFGMLAGGVISAVIAMGLGYPCFRLRGHYFVIATIVIAEIGLLALPQLGLGRCRTRHRHSGARRQLAHLPVRPQQAAVFLFRAGARLRRLVRHLVAGGFQMGLLVARGEG